MAVAPPTGDLVRGARGRHLSAVARNHRATALRLVATRLVRSGRPAVLDLAGVSFLDASGVGVLLSVHRLAGELGCPFALRSPRGLVARILHITDGAAIPVVPDRA